jgi:membrane-associated protease RseP (regulator of RpoE activity)
MGQSPSDFPELVPPSLHFPPGPASSPFPAAIPRRPEPVTRYVLLFLLTVLTTTYAGQLHYASFVVGFSDQVLDLTGWALFARGLWYSVSILAILGCHEFGHYYACRYYGVDASAPFFLPAPLPITGTLGAFIRIRQPIPSKKALFDIGIAGPIAGFIVAVPLLLVGMYMSRVVELPDQFEGSVLELGEPLLFKGAAWLTFGSVPEGSTVNMHPIAFAAWFGMLATALNLFPIGQLDGGHISYAVLGRWSTHLTLAMVACLIGLVFVSSSWLVWAVLTVGMLILIGPRHPPVWDEHLPLDRTRLWLAGFAVVMFVLCFTPAPIQLVELLRGA